ncbi:probable root meristem growth factor 8 [Durio zibethinus]|uniref:Probable root meristem growth factor 8 n=1 Tax=Durio zibethinus TaxID=66656 RepID=A0A6P5XC14_DURZI|nr:probable root meristem growth factor 8 [Durio zibethinus]
MKLIVFIAVLCFSYFALQKPCSSLQIQLHSSNGQGAAKGVQLSPHTLPRKLRFTEEVAVKGNEAQQSISNTKLKEDISGKAYPKERETKHGSRGTRQEWMEGGPDISQYFTTDYSHVRRRSPIHNKSLLLGP